ncbi:hypothetical protein VTO42DRAFT_2333 [Malbranchea cinnamomea]
MASPLSPLSPSKQNTRSPFGTTNLSPYLTDTPLLKSGKFDFSQIPEDSCNDENGRSTTHERDSVSWTSAPVADVRAFGDDQKSLNDTKDESLGESLPSSPFQEVVQTEHTSAMRDFTPRALDDDDGPAIREVPDTQSDVEMEADQTQPHLAQTEQQRIDSSNDSMHLDSVELDDHSVAPNVDSETAATRDESPQTTQQSNIRKVSSMTVENEGMSVVFHRPDHANASDEDNSGKDAGHLYDTDDDTCLSTFSAVPNADTTLFSKLHSSNSPAKRLRESLSPRKVARLSHLRESVVQTPGPVRSLFRESGLGDAEFHSTASPQGSPTPRRKYPRIDDSLNLLEFTDHLNCPPQAYRPYGEGNGAFSPSRRVVRASPVRRSPVKMNLLDLDIPPAPTPRSIPTITPRELESLKSSFMSQISSLKATLSGRDAEVASLKEAVTDAERRVGEAMEEVRNEAARRETLEAEQREWERRGKEMESVLRGIKAEIVEREREKDRLTKRADDAEKAKEKLERKIVELESQLSATREATQSANFSTTPTENDGKSSVDTAKEVQDAVEKVARELHALYKSKHETKVAALKKSYEARWEKRVREAENKLKEALKENERLKTERDATMSGNDHSGVSAGNTTILRETEELEARKKMLEAKVKGLEQELIAVKQDCEALRAELKVERAEKGELVAVVDEWLAMQHDLQDQQQQVEQPQQTKTEPQRKPSLEPPTPRRVYKAEGNLGPKQQEPSERPSIAGGNGTAASGIPTAPSHPPGSNIRPRLGPGVTPKVPRFSIPSSHVRGLSGGEKNSSASGAGRIPAPGRSGIMSSIERMGRGGG